MEKVAIYCRLSDEDRNKANDFDESESIQNQKTLLTKYALEKGWAIYKIYSDDDYSGLDRDRPEFNEMINDARNNKFNIILCKHLSRFSRDMELIEKYLHKEFQEWKVRFVSVTDNVDTLDKGNKKSRQISGLVNEWYCEDISEAIKASFKVKREEGAFIGSFAPYGYKKDPNNKNKLIVDDEAANIIKMIYNWYIDGYGTQHISHMLNEQKIPNPTRYKKEQGLDFKNSSQTDGYGLWNKTTIRRILRNKVYIGYMIQGKRKKVSFKSKKVIATPKDEWMLIENTHEPIIDERTFKLVQEKIKKRTRSTGKGKTHIFANKVRCMDCGSILNKVRSGKAYEYLRCKLYARDPRKNLCTSHSIRLDKLEDIVLEKVRSHIKNVSDDNLVYRLKQEDEIAQLAKRKKKEISRLAKRIKEKEEIIKNLYIDKYKGHINQEQFNELNNGFIKDKEQLQERQNLLKEEVQSLKESLSTIDKWYETVKKYKSFDKLSSTMVNELIDHIEVGEKDKNRKKQKVKIVWNF
ncbi:recombinase family protein [Sporosalibacterium faouarense]|uniref:recombinase family protein n=1 Tax=Sporosalibacterium faouarense TaxID=516123 RepID=UPI00192CAD95|nr:recombinase family protein [Sporosalibacterium faouarense]